MNKLSFLQSDQRLNLRLAQRYLLGITIVAFLGLFSCSSVSARTIDNIPLYTINPSNPKETSPYQLKKETKYIAFYYSASWCPPCRKTTPALVEEYQRMLQTGKLPVEIVLVGYDRSEKEMLAYMNQYDMPWPAIIWDKRSMAEPYADQGIPHLTLVERSTGKIIAQGTGVSGNGSVVDVVKKMRQFSGVTAETPFQISSFLDQYGILIALVVTLLVMFLVKKWKKARH